MYYLFSQSPGSGGENAYKLAGSPLGSSLRLLFAREPTLLFALFFSSAASFFLYSLEFFVCLVVVVFFSFKLASKLRRRDGPSAPRGLITDVDALDAAPSVSTLFFIILCFSDFYGSKDL